MSGIIRIDLPKGVKEGSTSVSPESPQGTNLASPPISRKGAILLGYGAMTAKSVYNTAMQEIRAGGNEEMATTIENGVAAVGIGIAIIETQGLILIPMVVETATTIFTRSQNMNRANRAKESERSMLGSRLNYMSGGGYE